MNTRSLSVPLSARVYTIVLTCIVTLVTAASGAAPPPSGITIEPMLAKGSATAPVTIVEFSDYQ